MIELRTSLELYDSENALFNDVTGNTATNSYGKDGNIPQTAIDGIRLLIANYTTLINKTTLTDGDSFVPFTQYIKTAGTISTVNGKSFDVGGLFVPQVVGLTVPSGDTWETTGYYVPQIVDTWTPTAEQVPLNLNVTELGGQANSTIDQNMWAYEYEIYFDSTNATFAAEDGAQYIVIAGNKANYNGNTYNLGEVFTATDTSNIVPFNTDSYVAKLYGTKYAYAPLLYSIKTDLNDAIERQIGKNTQDLVNTPETEIQKIRNIVESLEYSAFTGNVSLSYCYETILYIQSRLTLLLS